MASTGVRHANARSTTTSHTSCTPYSVGQHMPPQSTPRLSPRPVHHGVRSPSPNYFGLTVDSARDRLSSAGSHAKRNWSPPTSNVRSAAAASPRVIPLDQNPDFDAFRRASEANGVCAMRMSSFSMAAPPNPRRSSKHGHPSQGPLSPSQIALPQSPAPQPPIHGVESKFAETKQRSPKRLLSSPVPQVFDRPRRNSPAGFNDRDEALAPQVAKFLDEQNVDRRSLPPSVSADAPTAPFHKRADTLPASTDDQVGGDGKGHGPALISPQQVLSLLEAQPEQTLLLDVRVSTQYAKSRIKGALNLCIPTTLLKRPAYNIDKLSATFKIDEQREKFDSWRTYSAIIIYDTNSSKMKDAGPCIKMLEKFQNEGWSGMSFIIRGGFLEISKKFPQLVSHGFDAPMPSAKSPIGLAPVIGGCPMPQTEDAANPFFGNIRQNMDLIGGVGQIALQKPSSLTRSEEDRLPRWLKKAIESPNQGKAVSDKFLVIEQHEQKRMQQAMSQKVSFGTPRPGQEQRVQLAGIEKGQKNRYNNIWPYEHSRVKLEGVPRNGCDYVNANHIKAQWSNKRYIATQGPIPATFNDFWNMIWQQDVRVIVMLTAETENGQLKAHNYWSDRHYGSLTVSFHSEHRASLEPGKIHRPANGKRSSRRSIGDDTKSPIGDHPYVTVRNFTISNSQEPFERMREIVQLHYTQWPDFGAPANPMDLLGLVEQSNACIRASMGRRQSDGPAGTDERPVLVHCSAGCGRTGTFCTVDSVLDMLKRQRREGYLADRGVRQPTPMDVDPRSRQSSFTVGSSPSGMATMNSFFSAQSSIDRGLKGDDWLFEDDVDLVQKAVEDFRLQRLSMVQSLRQYVLCYESIVEWLHDDTMQS